MNESAPQPSGEDAPPAVNIAVELGELIRAAIRHDPDISSVQEAVAFYSSLPPQELAAMAKHPTPDYPW
jgi:hypothetical protein